MLPEVAERKPILTPLQRHNHFDVTLDIGGIPISLRTADQDFCRLLQKRYVGFVNASAQPVYQFEVEIAPPSASAADEDVCVTREAGLWRVRRGDFQAEWDTASRKGRIRQTVNPYSADTLLRIVHSIGLAGEDGFLLHAASAIRNGRAFLFAGVSGAGKTTLARLAPPEVQLLTDEISYVRKEARGYRAFGTPFAGELGRPGENTSAPVAGLFFLHQGPENRIEPLVAAEAARKLLRNILFLTRDEDLAQRVFHAAVEFIGAVPARRLTFAPTPRAWELLR
ncbi:MAG TPA: hypothetical protein VEU31_00645 [Candidatus Acidoferrales bacterium]|nr:hypothetical protein [Candidatus Acidoferrales bacterium]